MSNITPSNLQLLADSYAKSLIDLQANFVAAPASAGAVGAINGGLATASPSAMAHILALQDAQQELALLQPAQKVAQAVATALANITQLPGFYALYQPILDALDSLTGGLSAFLATNGIQVHAYFGAAFNAYAPLAITLGLRPLGQPVSRIQAQNIFIATTQSLGTLTIGASSNTFTAGTSVDGTQFAPAPLALVASGLPGTGAHTPLLAITYIPSPGAAPTTVSVRGSATNGAAVAAGVNGLSVTNITTTDVADTGAVYTVQAQPLRTITTY